MRTAPKDTGTPAAAPMARAKSAFSAGGFIDSAMSQSRENLCALGSGGARSRGAAGHLNGNGRRVGEREIAEIDLVQSQID
jgi:hypothetical protein